MKNKQLVIFLMCILLVLTACSGNKEKKKSSLTKTVQSQQLAKTGIQVTVADVAYTLNQATLTKQRIQGEKQSPKYVLEVKYTIKNENEKAVTAGLDLMVYDKDNFPASNYPLNVESVIVAKGEEKEKTAYYIVENLGKFELQFTPFPAKINQVAKFQIQVDND